MLHPSAKVIIKDPNRPDSILLIERNVRGDLSIEPAGGKVEADWTTRTAETLEQCAIREVREEMGYVVDLIKYVGSYSFFWVINPSNCSVCAVFTGLIVDVDSVFSGNADSCELPMRPIWVTREDILSKRVKVDPRHRGLEEILFKSFDE